MAGADWAGFHIARGSALLVYRGIVRAARKPKRSADTRRYRYGINRSSSGDRKIRCGS